MRNSLTPANAKADHSQQKEQSKKATLSEQATVAEEEEEEMQNTQRDKNKDI